MTLTWRGCGASAASPTGQWLPQAQLLVLLARPEQVQDAPVLAGLRGWAELLIIGGLWVQLGRGL